MIGLIPVRLTRRPMAAPCRRFLTTDGADGADKCEFMRIRFICANRCSSVAKIFCGAAAGGFAEGDSEEKSESLYLLAEIIPSFRVVAGVEARLERKALPLHIFTWNIPRHFGMDYCLAGPADGHPPAFAHMRAPALTQVTHFARRQGISRQSNLDGDIAPVVFRPKSACSGKMAV